MDEETGEFDPQNPNNGANMAAIKLTDMKCSGEMPEIPELSSCEDLDIENTADFTLSGYPK